MARKKTSEPQWNCAKCGCTQTCVNEDGAPKIARFRTGFVGVKLVCNHWAAVKRDRVA